MNYFKTAKFLASMIILLALPKLSHATEAQQAPSEAPSVYVTAVGVENYEADLPDVDADKLKKLMDSMNDFKGYH